MTFYTYLHVRADDMKVFYVGKGSGDRMTSRHHRNTHWHNTVKKHGFIAQRVAPWEDEKEAFEHEKLLIACFLSMGHPLCNRTEGGEGAGHYFRTAETRSKFSVIHKGKVLSAETRKKISDSKRGRKTGPLSDERKAKISASQKGRPRSYAKAENSTDAMKFAQAMNLRPRWASGEQLSEFRANVLSGLKAKSWQT